MPYKVDVERIHGAPEDTLRLTSRKEFSTYEPGFNNQDEPLLISAATPWQAKDGKAIRAVVVKDTKELFAAIAQVVKAVKMGYRLVPEVGTVPPEGIDKD